MAQSVEDKCKHDITLQEPARWSELLGRGIRRQLHDAPPWTEEFPPSWRCYGHCSNDRNNQHHTRICALCRITPRYSRLWSRSRWNSIFRRGCNERTCTGRTQILVSCEYVNNGRRRLINGKVNSSMASIIRLVMGRTASLHN